MWKKLFVFLLSLNLLAFVSVALWFGMLPKASKAAAPVPSPMTTANVQLTIGEQAINTYLSYALDEQPDMQKVLGYARVSFDDHWNIQLGLKVADRLVPCDIELVPDVHNGDLWLPLQSARVGGISVPKTLLFYLFHHVPWPSWIVVDSVHERIDVNLTERPQSSPYRIRALRYAAASRAMTFLVSIMPKQMTQNQHG